MKYCDECGKELPEDWEFDICEECMNNFSSAVILEEDIWPDEDDFTD